MAKQSIFCDETMVKPSDEQVTLDTMRGIGNPGQRGLCHQPQPSDDSYVNLGVSNIHNKGERK